MTWNYRVIKTHIDDPPHGKVDWFALHEVHYASNNGGEDYPNIRAWTSDPVDLSGDSVADIRGTLDLMEKALDKPVLDNDDLHQQVTKRPYWKSLLTQIENFETIGYGWDGYEANPPLKAAIDQAMLFVKAAESLADPCEATLHVDGSVILEIDMGDQTYELRFRGDGRVVYTCGQVGIVGFDGSDIPGVLREVLQRAMDRSKKASGDTQ